MARNHIFGYIVTGPNGPYSLGSENILWLGAGVTLFPRRERAARALLRTKKYREKKGYGWAWFENSYIHPVRWVS